MNKQKELDQYFTPDEVSDYCVKFFKEVTGVENIDCVEPAAGGGSFVIALRSNGFNNITQYDLDPRSEEVIYQDFLELEEDFTGKAVITNPPFGYQNNLSIKFINHAAKLNAEYICILALASLGTNRLKNRVNLSYTLVDEVYIKTDFDKPNGDKNFKSDLRCLFQVWRKSEEVREKLYNKRYIEISSDYENSDFFMKTATTSNRIYTDINEVLKEDKNFTNFKWRDKYYSRLDFGHTQKYLRKINGEVKGLSPNLCGFKILEDISLEQIKEAIKAADWRASRGKMLRADSINELIYDYLNGRVLKTKTF